MLKKTLIHAALGQARIVLRCRTKCSAIFANGSDGVKLTSAGGIVVQRNAIYGNHGNGLMLNITDSDPVLVGSFFEKTWATTPATRPEKAFRAVDGRDNREE